MNSSHNIPDMPKYMHTCTTLSMPGMDSISVLGGLKNDK